MNFRLVTRRAAVAGALLLPWSGAIAAFPDRPVRIVLGFPPAADRMSSRASSPKGCARPGPPASW
jgi:hypothetical protein